MMMPGRTYSAGDSYRYGFNGKENDNEVKGVEGSQQDYGMRIYDPRIGRFLSVDPIASELPWNTPYSFAENDPVNYIDFDGLEKATPKFLEYARQISLYHRSAIERNRNLLSLTTDEKVINILKTEITCHQKAYGFLVRFRYMNRLSTDEQMLEQLNEMAPYLEKGLDLTPAGDVKVLITGKNFREEYKSRWEAAGWLLLDAFGAEIASGLGKAGRAIKTMSGPGVEVFESVVKKVNNISKALDETHIVAAIKDIAGKPIKINGKVYDHLTEVKNALNGLGNQISKLDELINSGKAGENVFKEATELRNTLQRQKDAISSVLQRAEKKFKK
jgi:RHS repeat-associated protein